MTNRLDTAADDLFAALEPILPGRVAPTPPAGTGFVAPYIWIGDHTGTLGFVGTNTRLTVANFPVWIVYDGTVRAQVAGLNELTSQVWDACCRVPHASPQGWTNETIDVGGTSRRAVVVAVDVTLGAVTLCLPPAPNATPIPVPA